MNVLAVQFERIYTDSFVSSKTAYLRGIYHEGIGYLRASTLVCTRFKGLVVLPLP